MNCDMPLCGEHAPWHMTSTTKPGPGAWYCTEHAYIPRWTRPGEIITITGPHEKDRDGLAKVTATANESTTKRMNP